VFVIRCTAKLLKLLKTTPETADVKPTTRLGNWYASILWAHPRVLLCVSERTLLPVVISGRSLRESLLPQLRHEMTEVLRGIGIDERRIAEEEQAMAEAHVGKTSSRRVLAR
jgi:hypothetical protein